MKIEEEIKQDKFQSVHHKAIINLLYTANWIQSKHQEFLKPFGITAQQFNILRIMRGQFPKSISASEIKSRMLDRNSDVSRLLDRLALKELISKSTCASDKRANDVCITDKGLDLLSRISIDQKIFVSFLKLSEEEAEKLSDLLDRSRS